VRRGLLVIVLWASAGCSHREQSTSEPSQDVSDVRAFPSRQVDLDDLSTVAVVRPGEWGSLCSAAVVGSRVVLTAAHCLGGRDLPSAFEVWTSDDISLGGIRLPVTEVHVAPGYRPGALDDQDADVAVLVLDVPAPLPRVLRLNRDPLPDSLTGAPVRFVGYGRGNDGSRGGLRTMDWTAIAQITPGTVVIPPGEDNPCHGDSGGPMLLSRDGADVVIGIGHIVFDESCTHGADYTRVDAYASFIQDVIDAHP
jgi:secreted trypsin-like serine protease